MEDPDSRMSRLNSNAQMHRCHIPIISIFILSLVMFVWGKELTNNRNVASIHLVHGPVKNLVFYMKVSLDTLESGSSTIFLFRNPSPKIAEFRSCCLP